MIYTIHRKKKQKRKPNENKLWQKRHNVWIYFASHFVSNKNKNKTRKCDLTWRLELFFSWHKLRDRSMSVGRYSLWFAIIKTYVCCSWYFYYIQFMWLCMCIRSCTCACLNYKGSFILTSFSCKCECECECVYDKRLDMRQQKRELLEYDCLNFRIDSTNKKWRSWNASHVHTYTHIYSQFGG